MKARKVFIPALLLVLLTVMPASAQDTPTEPGPPPPIDPRAIKPSDRWGPVEDPEGRQFPVLCDPNWCFIPVPEGMTPEEFEERYQVGDMFPAGCWNSEGNVCVVAPNGDEADGWLRDWAHWMYSRYGNNLCVLLDMHCAIPGWEVDVPRIPPTGGGDGGGGPASSAAPTPTPTPTPRPAPTSTPPEGRRSALAPSDAGCPPARWWRNEPVVAVEAAPAFPIVVGQDPDAVGVVYTVTVTVPPVVYERWWREPDRCVPVPDADGDGRPDRQGSCTTWIGDPPVAWPGDLIPGRCHLDRMLLPDPVAEPGSLDMVLRDSSRRWIQTELAVRYPGARVRMPEIRMTVEGTGGLRGDRTFVYRAEVNPKPVDPGIYDVTFTFRTAGTAVTPPLTLRKVVEQKVYLLETTLVK